MPSRSAIDRLGERLRSANADPDSLKALAAFCADVKNETASIVPRIREATSSEIVSRDGKSFKSIIEKLRRQKIRLSSIQDIEGSRIVVDSRIEQDALVYRLAARLQNSRIIDRREHPSNGYRAVHVIAKIGGYEYEIQIRTRLQHAWAQLVELFAGLMDQSIKYGGGSETLQSSLTSLSDIIASAEYADVLLFEDRNSAELKRIQRVAVEEAMKNMRMVSFDQFLAGVQVDDKMKAVLTIRSINQGLYKTLLQTVHALTNALQK